MYPPILRVHLKHNQQRTYQMKLMLCFCACFFLIFFIKAYVTMQFKWVPTTYAFIKKSTKSTLAVILRLDLLDCALIEVCVVIRLNTVLIFFFCLHENIYCGTHQKCLIEVLLMSTHNKCFHGEIYLPDTHSYLD